MVFPCKADFGDFHEEYLLRRAIQIDRQDAFTLAFLGDALRPKNAQRVFDDRINNANQMPVAEVDNGLYDLEGMNLDVDVDIYND